MKLSEKQQAAMALLKTLPYAGQEDFTSRGIKMSTVSSLVKKRRIRNYRGTYTVRDWYERLQRITGSTDDVAEKDHGFRNHYAVAVGSTGHTDVKEMEAAGLVKQGHKINLGRSCYYHATRKGCEYIRLDEKATARAMAGREEEPDA